MSGGSWDYLCHKVEDAAGRLVHETDEHPLRQELGHHLRKVAKALHDIEWVDSCDYGPGDELAAIREVLGPFAGAGETEFAATLRALADDLEGDCDRDVVLLSDAHAAAVQHSTLRELARRLRWRAELDDKRRAQRPHVVRHESGAVGLAHPVGRVEPVEPAPMHDADALRIVLELAEGAVTNGDAPDPCERAALGRVRELQAKEQRDKERNHG